jgi:hypothetical protein
VNRRPYPSADRALHQLARHEHAVHRVKRLADGTVDETHVWPATQWERAMSALARAASHPFPGPLFGWEQMDTPRRAGRTLARTMSLFAAIQTGEHVHSQAHARGPICWNGTPDCTVRRGLWPGNHRGLQLVIVDEATDPANAFARVTCSCRLDTGQLPVQAAQDLWAEHRDLAERQANR